MAPALLGPRWWQIVKQLHRIARLNYRSDPGLITWGPVVIA